MQCFDEMRFILPASETPAVSEESFDPFPMSQKSLRETILAHMSHILSENNNNNSLLN